MKEVYMNAKGRINAVVNSDPNIQIQIRILGILGASDKIRYSELLIF
jgi:hypothetical protein